MTFGEAFARLSTIAAAHGDSFSFRVEAWRHHHEHDETTVTVEWVTWSSKLRQNFVAADPANVVSQYEQALGSVEVPDVVHAVAL